MFYSQFKIKKAKSVDFFKFFLYTLITNPLNLSVLKINQKAKFK